MDWTRSAEDFAPHISKFRDVYITNTIEVDWNQFLAYVRGSGLSFRFYRDGEVYSLPPSVGRVEEVQTEARTDLYIDPDGMCLTCHFFGDAEIELNFDPRDIPTPDSVARLSEFLAGLGQVLGKPVLVTHENQPHLLIWRYEPGDDQWTHWSSLQAHG